MTAMTVILDGDGCWPDLQKRPHLWCDGEGVEVARLVGGMDSGRSSLAIRGLAADGTVCIIQCSLSQMTSAVEFFNEAERIASQSPG